MASQLPIFESAKSIFNTILRILPNTSTSQAHSEVKHYVIIS